MAAKRAAGHALSRPAAYLRLRVTDGAPHQCHGWCLQLMRAGGGGRRHRKRGQVTRLTVRADSGRVPHHQRPDSPGDARRADVGRGAPLVFIVASLMERGAGGKRVEAQEL